jgi:hypothetical protein
MGQQQSQLQPQQPQLQPQSQLQSQPQSQLQLQQPVAEFILPNPSQCFYCDGELFWCNENHKHCKSCKRSMSTCDNCYNIRECTWYEHTDGLLDLRCEKCSAGIRRDNFGSDQKYPHILEEGSDKNQMLFREN